MTLPATEADLRAWLEPFGLSAIAARFLAEGWIGDTLLRLTFEDLDAIEVPRRRAEGLMQHLARLAGRSVASSSREAFARTCQLADTLSKEAWVGTVLDTWPGPIAHELHGLLEQLRLGRALGGVWQYKDLAEILCKLPATVMLADVVAADQAESGGGAGRALYTALFHKPLGFGDWEAFVRERLPQAVRVTENAVLPELAGLWPTTGGSPFAAWLQGSVGWRNKLSHSSLNPNDEETIGDLEKQIGCLSGAMPWAVDARPWADSVLSIAAPTPVPLVGWRSIHSHHEGGELHPHHVETYAVVLDRPGRRRLTMAPFLAARRCDVCARRDVFLFNDRKKERFTFLDYATAHTSVVHPWGDPAIADAANQAGAPPPLDVEDKGGMTGSMETLLEATAVDADYVSPAYLRDALRTMVEAQPSGVFWLQAPADLGKTQFIRGLVQAHRRDGPPSVKREQALLSAGLCAIGFHIRREQEPKPEDLVTLLHEGFGHALNLTSTERAGANYGALPTDPDAAGTWFRDWLTRLVGIARTKAVQRLLVCLDGLDELPLDPPKPYGVEALLVPAAALPEGVTLVLTSRPEAECAAPLWRRITAGIGPGVKPVSVGLTNERYRALLSTYFQARTAGLFVEDAMARLVAAPGAGHDPAIECVLTGRAGVLGSIRTKWRALRGERSGLPERVPSAALAPVLDNFARAEVEGIERADGRFRFVAFLVARLNERSLALRELRTLPKGEQLLESFDAYLRARLPAKLHGWAERLILLLAAADEADAWERRTYPVVLLDPEFHGLPLDQVGELLGDPAGWGASGPSPSLIYAIYAIRPLLGSWRGGAGGDASYRLGLKGMAETVRTIWPDRLDAMHRTLVAGCDALRSGDFSRAGDATGAERYLLRKLLAHADCSRDAALVSKVSGCAELIDLWKSIYAHGDSVQKGLCASFSLALLRRANDPSKLQELGAWLLQRSIDLLSLGPRFDPGVDDYEITKHRREYCAASIKDATSAILQLRPLYEASSMKSEVALSLGRAHLSRANALSASVYGDRLLAIPDYNSAIRILETEPVRPYGPFMEGLEDLIEAYANRGFAKRFTRGLGPAAATKDFDRAIGLRERSLQFERRS